MTTLTYTIEFAPRTEKQLKAIPQNLREKIMKRIEKLALNPRPVQVEPLQGGDAGFFRIRQGDYRIVYIIQDEKLLILVVRIVHRREVYTKKHTGY